MPAKKDEQESRTTTREAVAEPGSVTGFGERAAPRERVHTMPSRPGAAVASRHPQFMIYGRGMAGLQPLAGPELLEQTLRNNPDVEVLDVLTPRHAFDLLGGMPGSHKVLIARMDEQKASLFASQAAQQAAIERDHPLTYGQTLVLPLMMAPPSLHQALGFTATFKITANDAPVEGAEVCLFGATSLIRGVSDRQGELQLDVTGESPDAIRALYVNPRADCWPAWIAEPAINPSGENLIAITSLSATFHGFPRQPLVSWGQKAMKVDQLPPSFRGKGVKIGIIDSGVATGHNALRGQVRSGYDAIMKSQQGWDQDAIGNGTHCAGILCGRSPANSGIQGIAPEAELVVCKVSPGGTYSSLFEAFDFCIAQQVDVIQVSVTGPEPSQILEQKILQAKQLGIACIAAAGDSGGPVQYPAASPHVLAVAALGKQGEFPAQSYYAQTANGFVAPSGFYNPNFSCFGPQIGVCAPGVAVVSSVPPDNFAARDGSAVAAAHITGLAALILAHHPEFQAQGAFSIRSSYRVERLFQLIQQSSQAVNLGNPLKTGAGLPDATWAVVGAHTAAFPVPMETNLALAGRTPFFSAPLPSRPDSGPGIMAGGWPLTPGQGNMSNILVAIQQIRAMMQSAGLL